MTRTARCALGSRRCRPRFVDRLHRAVRSPRDDRRGAPSICSTTVMYMMAMLGVAPCQSRRRMVSVVSDRRHFWRPAAPAQSRHSLIFFFSLVTRTRQPPRWLRDHRVPRRRRNGGGLPRARFAHRSRGGHQDSARRAHGGSSSANAISARGAVGGRTESSNLLTIHELGSDSGRMYIVSELLDGTTLLPNPFGIQCAFALDRR